MTHPAIQIVALMQEVAELRVSIFALNDDEVGERQKLRAMSETLAVELALLDALDSAERIAGEADLAVRLTFAENLRRERERRGFTQETLAEAAGLDRSYVSAIERGEKNVALDNVGKLSKALSVGPAFLLHRWDDT